MDLCEKNRFSIVFSLLKCHFCSCLSGSWEFWKRWIRGTKLSAFVASLSNVNSEHVLWVFECALWRNGSYIVYIEGDTNKHWNIMMEKRQKQCVRRTFVANEPARVNKLLPVYDTCPVCVNGHEISIFRCVVWTEIISDCCWNAPLEWNIFY